MPGVRPHFAPRPVQSGLQCPAVRSARPGAESVGPVFSTIASVLQTRPPSLRDVGLSQLLGYSLLVTRHEPVVVGADHLREQLGLVRHRRVKREVSNPGPPRSTGGAA